MGETEEAGSVPEPVAAPVRARGRVPFAVRAAALAAAGVLAASTRIHVTGHVQGIFLVGPRDGSRFEVTDDLLFGERSRLAAGASSSGLRRLLRRAMPLAPGRPALELEWDEEDGSGVVRSLLGDGRQLVTVFSRSEDELGGRRRGLFVGGSLADVAADASRWNESGMFLRDANGWHHVWCNANEGILDPGKGMLHPNSWRFLGSRVLINDQRKVVIESSHELEIGGETVLMDRFAHFRAGDAWFRLGIRIVNAGDAPIRFSYAYGDEPWVGNYGSGERNVGWVAERIVRNEGYVDPRSHRWAGIVDEGEGLANFIAWLGEELPTDVYFSDHAGGAGMVPSAPLVSNEPFIGLEWRDRVLAPGEGASILLSLGVADADPSTGRPKVPEPAGRR